MIFNSLSFCYFFLAFIVLYFLVANRFRWIIILGGSFWFYVQVNPVYLIYLIIPIIFIYFFSIRIERSKLTKWKKFYLILSLIVPIILLIYFKYTNFLHSTLIFFISDSNDFKPLNILLPVGISFFTFKLISYSVDVYRGKIHAEKHFGYFAVYVSFFPQILMGPIERAVNFIPELKKKVELDFDRVVSGIMLFSWGIFKKMVISDRLAIFVNDSFSSPTQQGINLIFAIYFYSFQIYCDFSGYTDMAIGLTRILGFKSMKNFDFPYFSRSMTQFWNKWHISLSTWLRDYLFLPIAYRTMRNLKSEKKYGIKIEYIGYAAGMFITMFLGGLWHGAAWTFVIWGILHGIYLIVGYTTKKARKKFYKKTGISKFKKIRKFLSIFITFNLVSFAWIFFRSDSFSHAYLYISSMILGIGSKVSNRLVFYILLLLVFIVLEYIYKNRTKIKLIAHLPQLLKITIYALFIYFIILFSVNSSNEFIYMRF